MIRFVFVYSFGCPRFCSVCARNLRCSFGTRRSVCHTLNILLLCSGRRLAGRVAVVGDSIVLLLSVFRIPGGRPNNDACVRGLSGREIFQYRCGILQYSSHVFFLCARHARIAFAGFVFRMPRISWRGPSALPLCRMQASICGLRSRMRAA